MGSRPDTNTCRINASGIFPAIDASRGIDRVCIEVRYRGVVVDSVLLPLCGQVSGRTLVAMICRSWGLDPRGWELSLGLLRTIRLLVSHLRRALSDRSASTLRHPRAWARRIAIESGRVLAANRMVRRVHSCDCDVPPRAGAIIAECRSSTTAKRDVLPAASAAHDAAPTALRPGIAPPIQRPVARVPVLMYHRVSASCVRGLERWCVSPADFEWQLQFLRSLGYYSVLSSDVVSARQGEHPMRGRPILLTFDDGYRDFYETAWPLLRRYGFDAEVFIVADKIGGHADWDRRAGPGVPLMARDQIAELARAGVRIGSHLASHRDAKSLSTDELLVEAARSRFELETLAQRDVTSVSVPYGHYDSRVLCTLGWCGYEAVHTTDPRVASLRTHALTVPRLEIRGDEPLRSFAAAIGRASEFRAWVRRIGGDSGLQPSAGAARSRRRSLLTGN